jgi:hypothetical protein
MKEMGHEEAVLYLSKVVNDPQIEASFRITAAASLAPFQTPKLQALPYPRFVEIPFEVPTSFAHVSEAETFLAKIALTVAAGKLDIQTGQELSAMIKLWIDSQYAREELQFKMFPPEEREQTIKIEGGLPVMPGHEDLIMPAINGRELNGHALEALPVAPAPGPGDDPSGANAPSTGANAPPYPSNDSTPSEGQGP